MKHASNLLLLAALALSFTGCNDPLNVQDPDIVPPGNLNDKTVLPTIRAGAIGDFALAYTGSGADGSGGTVEGVTMYGGLLGDELINSETFPTRIEVDARGPIQKTNADVGLWFRNMQRARRSAEFSAERYRSLSPDTTKETGFPEVITLAGYTYIFLAETWCSGVPVSHVDADGKLTYGAPLTTTQLLDTAIARFVAEQDDHSAPAFAPQATGPALPYRSSADPRIPWQLVITPPTPPATKPDTNKGFDGSTLQFDQLRYTSRSTSITLATGAEARLIEAEAQLQNGDTATNAAPMYTTLNALRSSPPSYFTPSSTLGALTTDSATGAGGAKRLLFRERAYWLWLTAHRLGDLRRLIRQYGFAADSVFPSGPYFKSQVPTYGSDVNFPVPVDEENNPNFTQCIDRNP